MPVNAGDLEVVAKIRDEVTPGMAGIAAGVAAVAAGLVTAGKRFADFEGSMNTVKAVTGATSREMEGMSALAKRMGSETAFSAKEAAEGMAFLGRAGFDANQIMEALPATLNLAAAGELSLADASDIASNVLAGFGKTTAELGGVTDVLAAAAAGANTDVQSLGHGISIVGPVASNVGVSLEQTAAAIGLLGDKGVPAEVAATGLRGAIARLLNPSKEAAAVLTRLGVTGTDAAGEMRPLEDIIGDLEKSGLSAGDAMEIFGQRAGPVMLNLVATGAENFREFTRELENSGGAAQDMADVKMEGLHGSFVRLESAVDTAMISIGEGLSGVLIPVLDQVAESATAAGDAFGAVGEQQSESAKKTIEDWKKVQTWFEDYNTWFEERTGVAAEKAETALRDRIQAQAETAWGAWRTGATDAAKATEEVLPKVAAVVPVIQEVTRRWVVQNKEVQGVISSHYELGNVIRDIEDVLDDSKYGRLEFPGTSKPEAVNAAKVEESLKGAAKSLVTTVAGGTIGGIFNSLASGDWVGAAQQGIAAVWGFLSGRDDKRRRAQQEAQAARIKMWEEEREARIAAAKAVWEAEKKQAVNALKAELAERIAGLKAQRKSALDALEEQRDVALEAAEDVRDANLEAAEDQRDANLEAAEEYRDARMAEADRIRDRDIEVAEAVRDKRLAFLEQERDKAIAHWGEVIDALELELDGLETEYGDAVKEMFDWDTVTDDFETFLKGLADHIDADAIRNKIQGGLDQLKFLEGRQSDVQGLQSFVQKFVPKTGLDLFRSTGQLDDSAAAEYVAAGGDKADFESFAEALSTLEGYLKRPEYIQDAGVIAELENEVGVMASRLNFDIDNVLLNIHEAIKDVRAGLETEIDRLKDIITEPLKTEIQGSKETRDTKLDTIATAVEAANAAYETKSDEVKDLPHGRRDQGAMRSRRRTRPRATRSRTAYETKSDEIKTTFATKSDQVKATFATKTDQVKAAFTTMLTGVQTTLGAKLDALIAKEWNVEVHMKWPKQPGGGGGGGSSGGGGTAENPSSNAMGGPVGAGEYSWVGEEGKELVRFGQAGNVTPNHALGGDIVVQIDGEEVARASARHLPGVADEEGW